MAYVALRKTKLVGKAKLPRPKLTQEVLHIGTKEECLQKIDEIILKPENISDDLVEVELVVAEYGKQKNFDSKTRTKNNGKRNPRSLS